jgi:hypothetical protein
MHQSGLFPIQNLRILVNALSSKQEENLKKMKRRFKIQDRFTNMKKADGTPMSRQQIHMLRKRARGLCWICNKPALEGGYFCLDHQIQARERMRKKLGCKRRNLGALSYKLKKDKKALAARLKTVLPKGSTRKTAKKK